MQLGSFLTGAGGKLRDTELSTSRLEYKEEV